MMPSDAQGLVLCPMLSLFLPWFIQPGEYASTSAKLCGKAGTMIRTKLSVLLFIAIIGILIVGIMIIITYISGAKGAPH